MKKSIVENVLTVVFFVEASCSRINLKNLIVILAFILSVGISDNLIADTRVFKVTKDLYNPNNELCEICQQEFGDTFQLADWNDVKSSVTSGTRPDYILEQTGIEGSAFIKSDDEEYYSSGRRYAITWFQQEYPNYSYSPVDDIDEYEFGLSHGGNDYKVLCFSNLNNSSNCPSGECEDRYDEGYETGKQYCIDNPEECGISVSEGCSQAALDAEYQSGYNVGCSACSEGSFTPATLSAGLDMHIPVLQCETLLGTMNLWADFEFAGENNGDMLWKLSDFGQK